MALLETQTIKRSGVAPSYTPASAGGDSFLPTRETCLHVKNGGGAAVTVTVITTGEAFPGAAVDDTVVTVPAGAERLIGPFPAEFYGSPIDGFADIDYSAVASVSVAVLNWDTAASDYVGGVSGLVGDLQTEIDALEARTQTVESGDALGALLDSGEVPVGDGAGGIVGTPAAQDVWLPNLVAPFDPRLMDGAGVLVANEARLCRVIVPKTGFLRDLTARIAIQSGNMDLAVYSTAATRARLWSSGSFAMPTAGWVTVDPNIAVTAGDQLDLAVVVDNITASLGRRVIQSSSSGVLPAGFVPAGGAEPKTTAKATLGSAVLPATIAEGSLSGVISVTFLMARVA